MRRIFIFMIILAASLQGFSQIKISDFRRLREGDLLFCVNEEGSAITDVTEGIANLNIEHVAIFHRKGKGAFVVEAVHEGVQLTPIDSFIARNSRVNGRLLVIVGRVKDSCHVDMRASVSRALSYIGKPYDFYFEPGDSALYCSELVQTSYVDKCGKLIFSPIPMSFHDKEGKVTDYWKHYYSNVGKKVPEGAPGSNPGELSRRKEIKIIYMCE